jgi:hypothetical protein
MTRSSSGNNFLSALLLFILIAVVIVAVEHFHKPPLSAPDSYATRTGHIGPPDIYPIAQITPGAVDPSVTQANLAETICGSGRSGRSTSDVRPPASYTNRLKHEQIQEYGYSDENPRDYEEDHFIPLELGGNPRDPKNLWPEPYHASVDDGGAHAKDEVENYLHRQVCSGGMSLDEAQKKIARDWYSIYRTDIAPNERPR